MTSDELDDLWRERQAMWEREDREIEADDCE